MAKADKTATASVPAAASDAVVIGGFTIEAGAPPAATTRVGRSTGENPYRNAIDALKAPTVDGAGNLVVSQFFVPVSAPEGITDPAEKTKAAKEAQRKMTNALTGHTRRAKKADAGKNFAIRSVFENDTYGVRVYRIEPEAVAEVAAA